MGQLTRCAFVLASIILVGTFTYGENMKDPHPLDCKLTMNESVAFAEECPGGTIELANVSKDVFEITYRCHPLEHMEYVITDATGKVIFRGRANIFSPFATDQVEKIKSGDKISYGVSPFGLVGKPLDPGQYTIKAIFKYQGLAIESNACVIRLEKRQKGT